MRCGCRRSCCSRRRSRRSRPITRDSSRAGRRSRRWRRRAATTCCAPGPGSAITRARAICTPARKPWLRDHGGTFPRRRRAPARAARHRRLHRGGDRGDRLRPAGGAGRRQCRARGVAAVRGRGGIAGGKAVDQGARADRYCRARRAGDFAQALMDLGATLCTPKRPACARCPWNELMSGARARRCRRPSRARRPSAKAGCGAAPLSSRCAPTAACCCAGGPDKGLLAAMTEVPGSEWTHDFDAPRRCARRRASRPKPDGAS